MILDETPNFFFLKKKEKTTLTHLKTLHQPSHAIDAKHELLSQRKGHKFIHVNPKF